MFTVFIGDRTDKFSIVLLGTMNFLYQQIIPLSALDFGCS